MKTIINSIKGFFTGLLSLVKGFLSDEEGEASSKRLAMLFLITCLGVTFIISATSKREIEPSEHLIDAVVTVILFLAGFTNVDRAIKAYKSTKGTN
jgi:hypothetical protein